MNRLPLSLFVALVCLSSCSCNLPTLEGRVDAASLSYISLVTDDGERFHVNIDDADPTKVPGVLPGDRVRVRFDSEGSGRRVLELEILELSYYRLIPGRWTDGDGNGFVLAEDGSASSVGCAPFEFFEWILEGDALTLNGDKSLRNMKTLHYSIISLDGTQLVLKAEDGEQECCLERR